MNASVLTILALLLAPGAWGASWREDFTSDPARRGWSVHGDASLFSWSASRGRLDVTWDSARTNSFFHRPLGTVLGRDESFRLAFELRLEELRSLVPAGTFQLAVGLLRRREAFQTNFFRGAGVHPRLGPRNIVEFDYFPGSTAIAPTFSAVAVGTNYVRWSMVNLYPLELTPGEEFQVELDYAAAGSSLSLAVRRRGEPYGQGTTRIFGVPDDFRVDTVSITSYSGANQPPNYGGQILARGWIDNLVMEYPDPGLPSLEWSRANGGGPVLGCRALAGWQPTLMQSHDLRSWHPPAEASAAHPAGWRWSPSTTEPAAYYRLEWDRP